MTKEELTTFLLNLESRDELIRQLRYYCDFGMIDHNEADHIVSRFDMTRKERYVRLHSPYEMYLSTSDGRWKCEVPDDSGKRRRIVKTRKEDLINYLYDFYKARERKSDLTVRRAFDEWLDYKVNGKQDIKPATRDRYRQVFNRFMGGIADEYISDISAKDLRRYIETTVGQMKPTRKDFCGFRIILKGMFDYARADLECTDLYIDHVINDIKLSKYAFRQSVKDPAKSVFTEEEHVLILKYLSEHGRTPKRLALLLMAVTGCRPGEAGAAKHSDFDGNVFFIQRTLSRYYDESGKLVYRPTDFPKSAAGVRRAIIPDKYLWILDEIGKLNPESEYIFLGRDGEPYNSCALNKELKLICRELGIPPRKEYAFRITYGTILLDEGVDQAFIKSIMGHTSITTTELYYHKDRRTMQEKTDTVNSLSVFKDEEAFAADSRRAFKVL